MIFICSLQCWFLFPGYPLHLAHCGRNSMLYRDRTAFLLASHCGCAIISDFVTITGWMTCCSLYLVVVARSCHLNVHSGFFLQLLLLYYFNDIPYYYDVYEQIIFAVGNVYPNHRM
jgi:hypothetical protein